MISNSEHSNDFMGLSVKTLTTGLNLVVVLASLLFIVFIVLMILILRYRSKKLKKKNSICEEECSGYSVESGVLSANILRMKINSSAKTRSDSSDSSDEVLYETDRRFVVDRVQPKRCSLRLQQSVSSVDSDIDLIPSIILSVITDEKSASVALIKAKNLRRSGQSLTDKLIPEGVFARIYPKNRLSSAESIQTDSDQRSSDEYFETGFVKSKKSKLIKFNEREKFVINVDCFPIRISLYELDKQKVRYNIGHCFLNINTRDNYQTNQIIELDLYSTIYKAKNSYLFHQ